MKTFNSNSLLSDNLNLKPNRSTSFNVIQICCKLQAMNCMCCRIY